MQEILQILRVKIHSDCVLDGDVDLDAHAQVLVGRSGCDIATGVETSQTRLSPVSSPSPASLPCLSQPEIYEHLIGALAVGKINIASPKE